MARQVLRGERPRGGAAMKDAKLDDGLEDSHQARHQARDYRRIELIAGEAR